jgi:hypothetical protein
LPASASLFDTLSLGRASQISRLSAYLTCAHRDACTSSLVALTPHSVFTALNFEDAPDYQRIRDIVLDGATPNLNSVTFDWEVRPLFLSHFRTSGLSCIIILQQPRVERTSGAWFERSESAAATPMPVHNQSAGWPKHAAPDLTPVDGPGGAKRARVEHMSTPAFSEALALQSHISGCADFRCAHQG